MPSKILQISEKPQNLHSYCCSTAFHPPFKKYFSIPELPTKFSPTKCCFPKTFFFKCRFHQILPSVVFPQSFQCRFHQILLYSSTSFILLFFSPREISPSLLYSQKAFAQFFSSGPSFLLY